MRTTHYQKARSSGQIEVRKSIRGDDERRFWSYVDRKDEDSCWEWTGARQGGRYGNFRVGDRQVGAHRYSLSLVLGRDVSGLVLHSCDNPPCVNPNHLREGSQKENISDCISRGRRRVPTGSSHGNSKLSEDDVRIIREMLRDKHTQKVIAERFGVTQTNISFIKRGVGWRHT